MHAECKQEKRNEEKKSKKVELKVHHFARTKFQKSTANIP